MKKLIRFINNKLKNLLHSWKIAKQVRSTKQLRKEKRTDYLRWKKEDQLFDDWNERTSILAALIAPRAKVIEFGAGNMALEAFLPSGCEYTPSDIVQRNPNFIKCDLNETISFDISIYDTAVFSGVLEYIYDIDKVFRQFPKSMKNVVLSYCCKDISTANRFENGWLSDYSMKDLEKIFTKYNYEILNYSEWRKQSIFNLRRIG